MAGWEMRLGNLSAGSLTETLASAVAWCCDVHVHTCHILLQTFPILFGVSIFSSYGDSSLPSALGLKGGL